MARKKLPERSGPRGEQHKVSWWHDCTIIGEKNLRYRMSVCNCLTIVATGKILDEKAFRTALKQAIGGGVC